MGFGVRHSPVVHEEALRHSGVLQAAGLQSVCRVKPVLDTGINVEETILGYVLVAKE